MVDMGYVVAACRLGKLLVELKAVGGGGICGKQYNGSKVARKLGQDIIKIIGTPKAEFTLEIDVGGSATLGGKTMAIVDTSKNTFANVNDADD